MEIRRRKKTAVLYKRILLGNVLFLGVVTMGSLLGISTSRAIAQNSLSAATSEAKDGSVDEYDRVAQVWFYRRMGASGWERGQEIYYMKCWICHNDYTIKADRAAAPSLRGLFKRVKLITGKPVNEDTVKTQILDGSVRMPSYRPVLNDKDLSDLLAYLRDKCCWDEHNPPANPRYRAH